MNVVGGAAVYREFFIANPTPRPRRSCRRSLLPAIRAGTYKKLATIVKNAVLFFVYYV